LIRALPLLFVACGDPVSNAVFYEDALFLAGFPDDVRFGPPALIAAAPPGDSVWLAAAQGVSTGLALELGPALILGAALRDTPPDLRTDTYREWAPFPVVGPLGGSAWARAEATRPESGTVTWTVEVSPDATGPWIEAGSGRHEPSGAGQTLIRMRGDDLRFDPEVLVLDYDVAESGRFLEIALVDPRVPGADPLGYWQINGDDSVAWTGTFDVAGAARPGVALVLQGFAGGRSEVLVADGGGHPRPVGVDVLGCWRHRGVERRRRARRRAGFGVRLHRRARARRRVTGQRPSQDAHNFGASRSAFR
jgi:hypothetical protein